MLKKILCVCSVVTLTACDNVDISRYPESIQNCYNEIIYEDNNCTTSKKTIVRYCQCTDGKQADLDAKWNELNRGVRAARAGGFFKGNAGGLVRFGLQNSARAQYDAYAEKLFDECAKKTGYTRIKNCPKKETKKDK